MSIAGIMAALVVGMPVFPFILWLASGFLMGPEAERSLKKCFIANFVLAIFGLALAGLMIYLNLNEDGIKFLLALLIFWLVAAYRYIGYYFEREDANELGFITLYFLCHGFLAYSISNWILNA